MKIELRTWAWLAAAVTSVIVVHDAGDQDASGAGFVSTKSAARRLFADLVDVGPSEVEVRISPSDGPEVVLRAGESGHLVEVDGEVIGPADPDALDGLVDSLRLATSLRAVSEDADLGAARRGTLTVVGPRGEVTLDVRGPAPDGSGLYGELHESDQTSRWVIEDDMGLILDQDPTAWVARRALVLEPGAVSRLEFSDAVLERGPDRRWRSSSAGTTALLSTDAVEARLARLLTARLDSLRPPSSGEPVAPFVRVVSESGHVDVVAFPGPCPGDDHRVLIDRGPGRWGCVDAAVSQPWPIPGTGSTDASSMLEPRLLPHGYGELAVVRQSTPTPSVLRRKVGDWVLELDAAAKGVTGVDAAAVFEWYGQLHEAEASTMDPGDEPPPGPPSVVLEFQTDSTATLRLSCWEAGEKGETPCRRDDGPWLVVSAPLRTLAFSAATFQDRRLTTVASQDVRAIEILGGADQGVRQSVHFDLGVWRLDAPLHPDEDEALSEPGLEDLLAAVSSVRAERWTTEPATEPLRRIRVERTPRRDEPSVFELALHPGCVVVVDDGATRRAARIGEDPCGTLGHDLLHPDALDYWLRTARSVELTQGDASVRLERDGEALVSTGPRPGWLDARLEDLRGRRATGVRQGRPSTPTLGTLRVLPAKGTAFLVEYGANWARLSTAPWFYAY